MSESTPSAASWNDQVIEQFHAGEQRIAGMFDRSSLLLLHTTGARSGQRRTSPLAYFRQDGELFIVASAAGRDQHPAWYFNLLAHPTVAIELWADDAIDAFHAKASSLDEKDRAEAWPQIVATMPGFGEYQTKTSRVIPVVRLDRV